MWRFRIELKEQLLDGRTMTYIANKVGLSVTTIISILNAKVTTRKLTALCIIKSCNPEAEINEYFIKEK